jgi:predicted XRE-type DNA-binding protein
MQKADIETIQALRGDVALQIARSVRRRGLNQLAGAKWLGIPQPTLSKIMNGRVSELSLELLIRMAVRAGVPLVLQTGQVPQEAGAFMTSEQRLAPRSSESKLADSARDSLLESTRRLTAEQRLDAFLEHSQLVTEIHEAGRSAETARLRESR